MDASYRLLAARYVRKQTRQLLRQLDGARTADDIEFVHQARVASRRLRAALRLFDDCFSGKKVKRWRRQTCRLIRGLGPARDKDVQTLCVRGVLENLQTKAHRAGMARLLLRLEQQRQAAQPDVVKAVDRFQADGAGEEMLAAAKKLVAKLKKRGLSLQSPFVFSRAEEHVLSRLDELMEYEESLDDPQDHQQHHAMRIAAKRLRYTMEICQPVYEGRLDEFVKVVKRLQTQLGDIHDCDVWVEDLEAFLGEERRRTVAYFGHGRPFRQIEPGLEFFREERRSRREELFGRLVDDWQQLNHAGVWEALVRTVQSPDGSAAGSPPPSEAASAESGPVPRVSAKGDDGRTRGDGSQGEGARRQPALSSLPSRTP